MKKSCINPVILSPLLLLILLAIGDRFAPNLTQTAAHPEIAWLKYFSIPLVGFSLGSVLFLGIGRNGWGLPVRISSFIEQHITQLILLISCAFLVYLSTLAVLRYTSLHTTVFDMGTYDNKIWRISVAPLTAIPSEVSLGHFQPILIFHALIYKILASPVIIQFLQAAAVISGVIPLYFIAKENLRKPLMVFPVILAYLLYPPVEFNAALDFHPDHLYIPLMLWAFYFAEKGDYWKGIACAGLGSMAKEPLILGAAFFGLYLILAKKKYLAGFLMFIIFTLIFIILLFFFLPYVNTENNLLSGSFPFTNIVSKDGGSKINLLINSLFMWKTRKLLFIYFLFAPLLFLPLLCWKRFLPAIPLIAIPLMSTQYLHSSADSQYTAGIIAPAFVALIFSLKTLEERLGVQYAKAFVTFVLVMTFTFNVANGPSLLSINFWKTGWTEIWHKSTFVKGEHERILVRAIAMVPTDPTVPVVSQGNINYARLAHRYKYWPFLKTWQDADYILLDTKKPPMVGDKVDANIYQEALQKLEYNPKFHLEFKQDGILLYKRLE